MEQAKHTAGPHKVGTPSRWHNREFLPIIRAEFPRVPLCFIVTEQDIDLSDADRADADRIVKCVNAHDELRRACDNALNVLIGSCVPAGGVYDRENILEAQALLRAALALSA